MIFLFPFPFSLLPFPIHRLQHVGEHKPSDLLSLRDTIFDRRTEMNAGVDA